MNFNCFESYVEIEYLDIKRYSIKKIYTGKCFCIKYDSQIKFLVIPLKNIWINELQKLTKLRVKQINRTYML